MIKFASLMDLKMFLDKLDNEQDALLSMIIESVSASFEGYTNREFEKKSRTEYFDSGVNIFRLRAFPIDSSIATILYIDGVAEVKDSDYFVFYDKGYIEYTCDTIKSEPKEISVVYTGGYTWTAGSGKINVPSDLSFACLIQSAFIFRNRKSVGLLSISMPDGSVNVNSQEEFLPQVLSVLDRYRL